MSAMESTRPWTGWVAAGVAVAALALLVVGMAASWQLGSVWGVVGVAALAVVLALTYRGGLSSLSLGIGDMVALKATWEQVRAQKEGELRRAVSEVVAPPVVATEAQLETKGELAASGEVTARRSGSEVEERTRREAIERVMADAAEWGWTLAHMGFKTPPRPQISWSDEGEPTIDFGVGGT